MTYHGRRAPNVSEYIAQLNAIPSAQDVQNFDNYSLDDDLAMFTNTHFFDFDLGQDADLQPANIDARGESAITPDSMEMKAFDFILEGKIRSITIFACAAHICFVSFVVVVNIVISASSFTITLPPHYRCLFSCKAHVGFTSPSPSAACRPVALHVLPFTPVVVT
jgi:hypothetical protein